MSHGFKQTYPKMHLELQHERPKWRNPGLWVLAAGMAVAIATLAGYLVTRMNIAQAEAAIAREEMVSRVPVEPAMDKQAAAVDKAVAGLRLPWGSLFMALEAAAGDGIRLISIVPDTASGNLRIIAQANSAGDMLEYLTALQQQPALRGLLLTEFSHPETLSASNIRFSIAGRWKSTER
jgi:hypothetical protein